MFHWPWRFRTSCIQLNHCIYFLAFLCISGLDCARQLLPTCLRWPILHFWTPVGNPIDLRILGAELGLRVGMFSDFETATSDSLPIQGRGIGACARITPRVTLKGGVIYLDRNKVKLLPAGGVLWQPNPDTRFDLFFPN